MGALAIIKRFIKLVELSMDMGVYLVAVRRDKRSEVSLRSAIDSVTSLEGVRLIDQPDRKLIVRVEVDDAALPTFVGRLSPFCHIETSVEHSPQRPSPSRQRTPA